MSVTVTAPVSLLVSVSRMVMQFLLYMLRRIVRHGANYGWSATPVKISARSAALNSRLLRRYCVPCSHPNAQS